MEKKNVFERTRLSKRQPPGTNFNVALMRSLPDLASDNKIPDEILRALLEKSKPYKGCRNVRGDGNCFYRAFIFSYIELMILKGPEFVQKFSELIKSDTKRFKMIKDKVCILPLVPDYLSQITDELKAGSVSNALILFYEMVCMNNEFDDALTMLCRNLTASFMRTQGNILINGLSIMHAIGDQYSMVEDFVQNCVLVNKEDAKTIVFSIVPLAFRINLCILNFDVKEEAELLLRLVKYPSETGTTKLVMHDCLDLHDESIMVLFSPGHYMALYSTELAKKYPVIGRYDQMNFDELMGVEPEVKALVQEAVPKLDYLKEERNVGDNKLKRSEQGENGLEAKKENTVKNVEEEQKDRSREVKTKKVCPSCALL